MAQTWFSTWSSDVFTRKLLALTAAVALGGACSLDQQSAPNLAGPSELGISLSMSATPDIITQDGRSTTMIEIVARDPASQPVRNLTLRAETAYRPENVAESTVADFGALSARVVSTNNDGRATLTYQAPSAPSLLARFDNIVTVIVTPVGTNYGNSVSRHVAVRLARPNNPNPNDAPVPRFYFSPTAPRENEDVFFDASASTDPNGRIVFYAWDFGDGRTGQGVRATHSYALAGEFKVALSVTDDSGTTVTTDAFADGATVSVGTSANPTAAFISSPSSAKVGGTVNFSAAASTAPTGREIVSYAWNFGDGSTGSGMAPSHVYGLAATYTVALTVIDNTGRKHTTTGIVSIVP